MACPAGRSVGERAKVRDGRPLMLPFAFQDGDSAGERVDGRGLRGRPGRYLAGPVFRLFGGMASADQSDDHKGGVDPRRASAGHGPVHDGDAQVVDQEVVRCDVAKETRDTLSKIVADLAT